MTYYEPQFLALPSRYTYPQQPQQVLEELAIQLHLLAPRHFAFAVRSLVHARRSFSFAPLRRCFLLGDRITHAIYQRDKECKVNGAGDAGAVLEIEGREFVDDGFDTCCGKPLP